MQTHHGLTSSVGQRSSFDGPQPMHMRPAHTTSAGNCPVGCPGRLVLVFNFLKTWPTTISTTPWKSSSQLRPHDACELPRGRSGHSRLPRVTRDRFVSFEASHFHISGRVSLFLHRSAWGTVNTSTTGSGPQLVCRHLWPFGNNERIPEITRGRLGVGTAELALHRWFGCSLNHFWVWLPRQTNLVLLPPIRFPHPGYPPGLT